MSKRRGLDRAIRAETPVISFEVARRVTTAAVVGVCGFRYDDGSSLSRSRAMAIDIFVTIEDDVDAACRFAAEFLRALRAVRSIVRADYRVRSCLRYRELLRGDAAKAMEAASHGDRFLYN